MRRAGRKDSTHRPIVEALEAHGIVVFDVSGLAGLGFDVLCYAPWLQKWQPAELKSDKKTSHKSSETQLKPSQSRAAALAPIPIWSSIKQALDAFKAVTVFVKV